jgi:uncharacterized protein (DUF39 family)
MQQHLMRFFEIKTYNDLTLINRINEIYTVKKLNAYHRYEIEFNSTNEDVRILLEKTFLEVIEAYHQELMPIQRTEKGVQRLKGRQADGVRVSR